MIISLMSGFLLGTGYAALARWHHESLIGMKARTSVFWPLILTITRFLVFFIVGFLLLRIRTVQPVPLGAALIVGYAATMTFYLRKR